MESPGLLQEQGCVDLDHENVPSEDEKGRSGKGNPAGSCKTKGCFFGKMKRDKKSESRRLLLIF